jgi:type II secretory pathway pseudopilin PulG
MAWKTSLLSLLRSNLLAIISLLIALASLSYNTWRNDATEANRNQRAAGFAALQELAALQLLTDHITYGNDHDKGDPIAGWTRVIFICDLARLTAPDLEAQSLRLKDSWATHVGSLDDDEAANKAVSNEIAAMREGTLKALRNLR